MYLTFQSNCINLAFHLLALASFVAGSPAWLEAWLVRLTPICFALAFQLTPLYYILDHFTAGKRLADKQKLEDGYVHVHLANHLCHAPALPCAIVHVLLYCRAAPSRFDVLVIPAIHALFFLSLTFYNKRACGDWTYPMFETAEKGAGWVGVPLLMTTVAALDIFIANGGTSIVAARQ